LDYSSVRCSIILPSIDRGRDAARQLIMPGGTKSALDPFNFPCTRRKSELLHGKHTVTHEETRSQTLAKRVRKRSHTSRSTTPQFHYA
jgi:hypothetical protein